MTTRQNYSKRGQLAAYRCILRKNIAFGFAITLLYVRQSCKRPTNSGPNPDRTRKYKSEPKNQFKAQIVPKKPESLVRFEKFSNVTRLF